LNAGQLNAGQLNVGQLNAGQLNAGQLNVGQLNVGQLNAGQLNVGQLNADPRTVPGFRASSSGDPLLVRTPDESDGISAAAAGNDLLALGWFP